MQSEAAKKSAITTEILFQSASFVCGTFWPDSISHHLKSVPALVRDADHQEHNSKIPVRSQP